MTENDSYERLDLGDLSALLMGAITCLAVSLLRMGGREIDLSLFVSSETLPVFSMFGLYVPLQ